MKKMLGDFTYNGTFYLMLLTEENEVETVVLNKSTGLRGIETDEEIYLIENVLTKLKNLKYMYLGKEIYNDEVFRMYYNAFNNMTYFAKKKDSQIVPCEYEEIPQLYDKYNKVKPVFNKIEKSDTIDKKSALHKNMNQKKKRKGTKFVNLKYCGLTITIFVLAGIMSLTSGCTLAKNAKVPSNADARYETEYQDPEIKELRTYLENEGYEEGEIRQVIEQFIELYDYMNGEKNHDTKGAEERPNIEISEKTRKIINAVNRNSNLTTQEKESIIEKYSQVWEQNIDIIDLEEIIEKMQTVTVEYIPQEDGYVITENNTLARGQYDSSTNRIEIYQGDKLSDENISTFLHEVNHVQGRFEMQHQTEYLNEGYTEYYNPLRESITYSTEQVFTMIMNEIYGEDFMKECWYHGNLYSQTTDMYENMTEHRERFVELMVKMQAFSSEMYRSGNSQEYVEKNASKMQEIFETLKKEYESISGQKWSDNLLLKLCYDKIMKTNTAERENYEEYEIEDIYVSGGEIFVLTQRKEPISFNVGSRQGFITPTREQRFSKDGKLIYDSFENEKSDDAR